MICQHCEDVEADRDCFVADERHPECYHRRQGSAWCLAEGGPHPDCRVCERCYKSSEESAATATYLERAAAKERHEDGAVDAFMDAAKERRL